MPTARVILIGVLLTALIWGCPGGDVGETGNQAPQAQDQSVDVSGTIHDNDDGDSGDDPLEEPNPCLSQCELQAPDCPMIPLEEVPDFETASGEWRAEACPAFHRWNVAVAGVCTSGHLVLFGWNSEGNEARYYDAVTGQFVALTTTTDSGGPPCNRRGYWPFYFECPQATVTEVFCSTPSVGAVIGLP